MASLVLVAAISAVVGFAVAAAPTMRTATEMVSPPSGEASLLLFNPPAGHPTAEINNLIMANPLTKKLEANSNLVASRPHMTMPPSLREYNFTGGTLLGDNKIPVPPLIFASPDGMELVSVQYLGGAMCGHPGVVHGGLLATLLDEGLARCCFPALPNGLGVTAWLKVDYRKPCMANQYVVLSANTTKVEGRKAWVKGRLEVLNADGTTGALVAEAEALFVEPKQAAAMARVYRGHVGLTPKDSSKAPKPAAA